MNQEYCRRSPFMRDNPAPIEIVLPDGGVDGSAEENGEGSMTRQCARAIDGAVALRPVRIFREKDELRHYTASTFKDPHQGCDWWLRLLSSVGYVVDEADQMLDVLDENGDIIQEVPITRKGFEFLRSRWHFRWEREATW